MLKLQANLQFQASSGLTGLLTLSAKFKQQLKLGQVPVTLFYEIDGRIPLLSVSLNYMYTSWTFLL